MFPDSSRLPGRAGGILLHPTSLPGPFGIGDLGPEAIAWLDWLSDAECSIWQILPFGPTGYADSPYQSLSAFAGNHLLISPLSLVAAGLLSPTEIVEIPVFPSSYVHYGKVIPWKEGLLAKVAVDFSDRASSSQLQAFEEYCEEQAFWLDDYAFFMALKHQHKGKPWPLWEQSLRDREVSAVKIATRALAADIEAQKVLQFLFNDQWFSLKQKAVQVGITIIGDMPLYVAHDSADVWAHPHLYALDRSGQPTMIAGVPPDYFSATGQRWGNPLYNWERMAQDRYNWWVARLRTVLRFVDVVRLDHFRGFAAYWEIPNVAKTAVEGQWVPGPGKALLDRLEHALDGLPLIAEDLGVITPEVTALRQAYNLPGMKVMQFGLEAGPQDEFLPHLYEEGCVAYSGTHDNDTTAGWYVAASAEVQAFTRAYLKSDGEHIAWDLIEALWASAAAWTIVPMQDPLELGSEARMNLPGQTHGNWQWRVREQEINEELVDRLQKLNQSHNRGSDIHR